MRSTPNEAGNKATGGTRAPAGSVLRWSLAFLLLSGALSAQFSDFATGLPAEIIMPNASLDHTPALLSVRIHARNPGDQDWTYYLLSNQNGTWRSDRVLGVVQPGEEYTFTVDLEASYNGKSHETNSYAVMATGNAVPLGRYFKVEEDWSAYENSTRQAVAQGVMVFVPLAGIAIFLILLTMAEWAYTSEAKGEYKDEYTMKTLVLPKVRNRPRKELLADILLHPLAWLAELLIVAGMAKLIWDGLVAKAVANPSDVMLLAGAGALLVPLVYFFLAWVYNEQVERMPLRFLAGMFFFGAACAVAALFINSYYMAIAGSLLAVDKTLMLLLVSALFAPFVEEFLKGAGLAILLGHHEFSDALHGLHLGFAVGLGFSFVENWFYFASRTDPFQTGLAVWVGLVIYRSFFNSISHAFFSAALGATLGWAKSQDWGRIAMLAFVPGLATAVALHSIFNITATLDGFWALSSNFAVYVFNPTLVIIQLGLLVGLFVVATMDHRQLEARKEGAVEGMLRSYRRKVRGG
ncbi:MAG: PrsW family intramembrane metalloprotease [Candidatus Micrarchaeota archaeon]